MGGCGKNVSEWCDRRGMEGGGKGEDLFGVSGGISEVGGQVGGVKIRVKRYMRERLGSLTVVGFFGGGAGFQEVVGKEIYLFSSRQLRGG